MGEDGKRPGERAMDTTIPQSHALKYPEPSRTWVRISEKEKSEPKLSLSA